MISPSSSRTTPSKHRRASAGELRGGAGEGHRQVRRHHERLAVPDRAGRAHRHEVRRRHGGAEEPRRAGDRTSAERRCVAAAFWDATGEHALFVAASAINELPETQELDRYAEDVSRRFPEAKRIPLRSMNFADLSSDRPRTRAVTSYRQPSHDMTNKTSPTEPSASRFRFRS